MCVRISWWHKNSSNLTLGMWSQINMTSTGFLGAKSSSFRHLNESELHPPMTAYRIGQCSHCIVQDQQVLCLLCQSNEHRCNLYISTSLYPKDLWGRSTGHLILTCWFVCEYFLNVNSGVIQVRRTSVWDTVKVGSSPQKVNMNPEMNLKHVCCTMFCLGQSLQQKWLVFSFCGVPWPFKMSAKLMVKGCHLEDLGICYTYTTCMERCCKCINMYNYPQYDPQYFWNAFLGGDWNSNETADFSLVVITSKGGMNCAEGIMNWGMNTLQTLKSWEILGETHPGKVHIEIWFGVQESEILFLTDSSHPPPPKKKTNNV